MSLKYESMSLKYESMSLKYEYMSLKYESRILKYESRSLKYEPSSEPIGGRDRRHGDFWPLGCGDQQARRWPPGLCRSPRGTIFVPAQCRTSGGSWYKTAERKSPFSSSSAPRAPLQSSRSLKSMSLTYEPASEPLHISVRQLFLNWTRLHSRRVNLHP